MRRARTWLVILVVLAIVGAALWLLTRPDAGGTGGTPAPSTPPPAAGEVPARPADAFPMVVRYVYDGDTVQLQHDASNDIVTTTNPIRVRLIGIDTPEGTPTPECWSDEARAHLAALAPEGSTVWVGVDGDTWDDYQRRLFYLWSDDGTFLNHALVAAGDAEAIRVWPNVAHYDLLAAAQAEAQASGLGQWGAC